MKLLRKFSGFGDWYLSLIMMLVATGQSFPQAPSTQFLYQLNVAADSLSAGEVMKLDADHWKTVTGINFGRKNKTGWAYLSLPNGNMPRAWLEIAGHFIDSVEVWAITGRDTTHFKPLHFRDLSNNQWAPVQHRYFLYEFDASRKSKVFIHGSTHRGDVLKFNVKVWQPRHFLAHFQREIWGWALFTGLVLVGIGTVTINFFFHRRKIFLYYAGYVFSISCYALLNDGWGAYLPQFLSFLDDTIALGHWLNLAAYCFTWFIRRFLLISDKDFKAYPPLLIFLLLELNLFAMHWAQYDPDHLNYLQIGYGVGFLSIAANTCLWILYIRDAIIRKFKPVWLLLLAIAAMFGFYFTNILLFNMGFLTNPVPDMVLFRIAFVTELAVLTIAWLYRQKLTIQEKQQLESDNYKLQSEIIEIQDAERQRIAQDLHDELGGNLATIKMSLQSSGLNSKEVSPLLKLIDETSVSARNIAHNLMPPNFEDVSMIYLLQNHFNKLNHDGKILFYFHANGYKDDKFNKQGELTLYRIIMELVSNIISHAEASEATIQLIGYETYLELMAEDDGKGFAPTGQKGIGLKSIQSRVNFLKGTFNIDSSGRGTTTVIQIPY